MNEKVDLELLRMFVAVAEARSFSAAAARLGVPVSSVSRGIARLEATLGHQVLHRTTRRVALSTAGVTLHDRTASLLQALEGALGGLPERDEVPSGDLRITAPNDIGQTLLAEHLPHFAQRYPAVHVDVHLTTRMVDVIGEGFDMAIRAWTRLPRDASLIMRRLIPVERQLFAAPTYLARRGLPRTMKETVRHDLVLFRDEWPARLLPNHDCARIVSDDYAFIRNALRNGAGIGPLPSLLAQADLAAGNLVRVLPRESIRGTRLVLLYPRTRHQPSKITAFRDFLIERLAASA